MDRLSFFGVTAIEVSEPLIAAELGYVAITVKREHGTPLGIQLFSSTIAAPQVQQPTSNPNRGTLVPLHPHQKPTMSRKHYIALAKAIREHAQGNSQKAAELVSLIVPVLQSFPNFNKEKFLAAVSK